MSEAIKELEGVVVGNDYHFFDDGKLRESRHYMAKVLEIIPYDEIKGKSLEVPDHCMNRTYTIPFELIWKQNVTNSPHLYKTYTDYVIKCSVPVYDENMLYFVRTNDNGWFSINVECDWQSGRLDVTGKRYEEMIRIYEDIRKSFNQEKYKNNE